MVLRFVFLQYKIPESSRNNTWMVIMHVYIIALNAIEQ